MNQQRILEQAIAGLEQALGEVRARAEFDGVDGITVAKIIVACDNAARRFRGLRNELRAAEKTK
jgi:hypothetical protein